MIGEAVGAVVTEDDVIEQGDAEELAGLPEAGSQGAVFGARSRIAGRVIVRAQGGTRIHEDERLEDFARVNDRQGERADRNDVKPDDAVLGIKSANHELFAIDALEAGSKERGGRHGSRDRQRWCCSTIFTDQGYAEARQAVDIRVGRLIMLTVAVDGAGFHVVLLLRS